MSSLKRRISVSRKLLHALLVSMLLLNLTGCGGMLGKGVTREVSEARQKLTNAVNMIRSGLENEARYYLEQVIAHPGENGVTDEALFRLALLKLNDGDLGGGKSSVALLERLRSSYPASVWTRQAGPLHSHLMNVKNIRNREREITNLHDKNLSLSKDVRELRQMIERLKSLDLELEQKIRK